MHPASHYTAYSTARLIRRYELTMRLINRMPMRGEAMFLPGGHTCTPRYSTLLVRTMMCCYLLLYRPDEEKIAATKGNR